MFCIEFHSDSISLFLNYCEGKVDRIHILFVVRNVNHVRV